jgi:hypothetical protein
VRGEKLPENCTSDDLGDAQIRVLIGIAKEIDKWLDYEQCSSYIYRTITDKEGTKAHFLRCLKVEGL